MSRPRAIADELERRLAATPVTILQGARQVGKSTLVQALGADLGARYLTLDEPRVAAEAAKDPAGFVDSAPGQCLIIDEAQRVPELVVAIKAVVDRSREPGRYLLTGSADLLWHPDSRDTLAGRATSIEMWPYSQGELSYRADDFINRVFDGSADLNIVGTQDKASYLGRACRGGFPVVIDGPEPARSTWLSDYLIRLQRDLAERGRQRRIEEVPELLEVLAGRLAQELNVHSIANDIALKDDAVRRYIRVLEQSFLVRLIPAFAAEPVKRGVRRPKVILTDTGLAASLLGFGTTGDFTDPDGKFTGPLIEAFVANEVSRQLSWADRAAGYKLTHYRHGADAEVDFVVTDNKGRVVGIEVKAGVTPPVVAPKGLVTLREELGDRFIAGLVLTSATEPVHLGDRVHALPIEALWSSGVTLVSGDDTGSDPPAALVADAQVFWSYAHADDERDGGRIARLAEAVRKEYEFLTGGEPLEVFIDQGIEWGDRWRESINAALHQTTMFVAILSPTYVRRPECRREFEQFVGLAERAGTPRLLLPIKYGPMPSEDTDPSINRLIEQASEHQWVDLQDLRFEDESSPAWRRLVNQLAQRLIEAAASVNTHGRDAEAGEADGDDVLAAVSAVKELEPDLEAMLAAFKSTMEIIASELPQPGVPSSRAVAMLRSSARRIRRTTAEPLDRLDQARAKVEAGLTAADSAIRWMVAEPDLVGREQLRSMSEGFEDLEAEFDYDQSERILRQLGSVSKDLRQPTNRLGSALGVIRGIGPMVFRWRELIDDALRRA